MCSVHVKSKEKMFINGQILEKKLVTNPYRMIVAGSTGGAIINITKSNIIKGLVKHSFANDFSYLIMWLPHQKYIIFLIHFMNLHLNSGI